MPPARTQTAAQPTSDTGTRVSRVRRRLRRRALLAAIAGRTRVHRRVATACWERPHLLRELARSADPARLRALVDATPITRAEDPNARLLAGLLAALEGDVVDHGDMAAIAGQVDDDHLRRIAAARLVRRGDADLAWAIANAAPKVELPAPHMVLLARNLTDTDALEELIERASAQLAGSPDDKGAARVLREALLSRGRVPYHQWNATEALHWFDRAHEETGPVVRTWTWRAKALRRLGRLEESRINGEAALSERPDWVPALVHMGKLYRQLGDRPASVSHWQRVLDHPKASTEHLRRTWGGLMRVRQLDLALLAAERLEEASGGTPVAHAMRAVTLLELGRTEEANRAIAPLHGRTDAASIRGLARFLGRTARAAEAYTLLQRLPPARWGPVAAEEIFHMLRRDGHLELAQEAIAAAAAANPHHGGLHQLDDEVRAELRVFRGEWSPSTRPAAGIDPVPGRVLHVVGRSVPYASSGYCVRTDYTVRAQRAKGIDVHVATQLGFPWEEGRDAPLEEDVGGVAHHRLPFPPDARQPLLLDERLERHVDALSDLVERLRPAVLHAASDFRNALPALAVGERFGLPVVYEMRGFWEDTWLAKREPAAVERPMYRLRRERETEAAHRAAHVVTLAPTMREDLVGRGIDPAKISVVPNAVAATAFMDAPRDDALARDLGIGPDQPVVGYISSFAGYEGIHVLIDAVARLHAQRGDLRCLLVGDGDVRPVLEHQVRALGLEDVVTFTGRVPHDTIQAYYSLIDVFVVPRTNARVCQLVSPLKPYEAMAAARAIVVSGTPVLRSVIEEGVTGVSFEPEDPDDLAARIVELAEDPDLRRHLGANARRHVLEHHTWERNAERYLEVYRSLGVAPVASERTA
jgi:PEP-CTERM/exosortase A-associated glycosyltransferase